MSERKDPAAAAAPPDPYPSAPLLGALRDLVGKRLPPERRARDAWLLVTAAAGNPDFAVVADFALENELIAPLEASGEGGLPGRVPVWTNPQDGSEMVWIPPGPFRVGPDRERAACAGFSLARHPVTNGQFARFVREAGYRSPADHPEAARFLAHWEDGQVPPGREDHPVVYVSLIDALNYCRWAGLGLPSEWLWEKAARGPEGRVFPWGDGGNLRGPNALANFGSSDTCAVGSFPRTRTAYGCEDMVGNVSEWCHPGDDPDYGRFPPARPEVPPAEQPPGPYAPVRGACFLRTTWKSLAAAHRRKLSITRRNHWVGFRPACLLPYRPAP
jgi:serine/threonine-protein kinase